MKIGEAHKLLSGGEEETSGFNTEMEYAKRIHTHKFRLALSPSENSFSGFVSNKE